jgi:hypothetical protein
MIDVMKQALETLEWGQPIIEDYGSKEQLQAHLSAKDALYKAIEQAEQWETSDMAHRSGGLSVEQAEKQEHKPWCDYLNIMLTSLPPQKAKCNCKQAQPEPMNKMPTKLFGPNLEQILNAAGFYKRDAVCCGDYKKCIEPCTPKGEWLAKQELAKPEPVTWAETNDLVCALLRQAHDVLACASYPFKRPWVSLTDEEIDYIWGINPGDYEDKFAFPRAIEVKLKEKNGG